MPSLRGEAIKQKEKGVGGNMTCVRLVAGSLTLAAGLTSAYSATAIEFSIQPRVSIGSQYYEYNRDSDASDINTDVSYIFGGLGVTGQVGKFFVDLYGQTNLTEGEDEQEDVDPGVDRENTVNRRELNLTAGFALTRNVTAFGGLKYAKVDLDNDFTTGTTIDVDTSYFGPFGGLALTFPISDFGALSLNGSLAYLDGEEKIENTSTAQVNFESDGTSIGYSVGLAWSGPVRPVDVGLRLWGRPRLFSL